MTDFKAKMHQIRFRLRGVYSAPPCWIWGPLRGRGRGWAGEEEGKREGKGRNGEMERRERDKRAPKLLLNQGPSETCYATESLLKY